MSIGHKEELFLHAKQRLSSYRAEREKLLRYCLDLSVSAKCYVGINKTKKQFCNKHCYWTEKNQHWTDSSWIMTLSSVELLITELNSFCYEWTLQFLNWLELKNDTIVLLQLLYSMLDLPHLSLHHWFGYFPVKHCEASLNQSLLYKVLVNVTLPSRYHYSLYLELVYVFFILGKV